MRLHRSPDSLSSSGNTQYYDLAVPIPASDRNTMIQDRSHFSLSSGTITYFDSTLLVSEIIRYFNQQSPEPSEGLRFYPGLAENNNLFNIMCLSNQSSGNDIQHTVLMNSTTSVPTSVSKKTAQDYIQTYWNNVLIDNQQQTTTNPIYKKSRYFSWHGLMVYLEANIPDFNIANSSSYAGYLINIEIGFVSETMGGKYYNEYGIRLYPGMEEKETTGYTVILSVLEPDLTPCIDEGATYEALNYAGRFLEFANVCPPKCGNTF